MALLTDYRQAVITKVTALTGITVKPGKFDGPVRNDDIGCCYPVKVAEDPANVAREILEVRVRLFKDAQGIAADPEEPSDPAVLEALIEQCQVGFAPSGQGTPNVAGIWFARLTEAEVNVDQWGIEFALVAVAWNQFAVV